MTKKDFIDFRKQMDNLERKTIRSLSLSSSKYRAELKSIIENLMNKYGEKELSNEINKYGRSTALKVEISSILTELSTEKRTIIRSFLGETYDKSFRIVTDIARNKTKKALVGIDPSPKLKKFALKKEVAGFNWAERITNNRNSLVLKVQSNVFQGIQNGESYTAIAQRIDDTIGYASKTGVNGGLADSVRIARTEAHRIINEAQYDSVNSISKKGVVTYKTWISSRDSRVRDPHITLDGTKIPFDENFKSPTGAVGKGPGMMNNPADDINCRCILVYTFE